ncbi:MAG TPA: M28 family peptidase [Myxococcales bacterium]|nr:M28 family peptidase [Myxococcales bacterium]
MTTRQIRLLAFAVAAVLGGACAPAPVLEGANLDALRAVAGDVDGDRAFESITALVTAHADDTPIDCSGLRYDRSPRLCHISDTLARDWVQAQFESYGLAVHRDEALQNNGYISELLYTSNVIAELPGATRPEEIVLVGAHFDANWLGADDNSSGMATVLEIARVLSTRRFARTIRFVGFDLEELYLVGSDRYVDTIPNDDIATALVFDCVAYFSSAPGTQRTLPGLPSPDSGDFLLTVGNDVSARGVSQVYALNRELDIMKVVTVSLPRDGTLPFFGEPMMRSDHTPFWLTGRQAVFLTDTANFRNPYYHTPDDTLDKLDKASFTRVIQLSAAAVAYWAGEPQ